MSREEMTREEAIRIAQGLITDFKCESQTMVEFCNVVIKALEQEPVLDKIRAEIQKEKEAIHFDISEQKAKWTNSGIYDGLTWAQEIIDKYRKEN